MTVTMLMTMTTRIETMLIGTAPDSRATTRATTTAAAAAAAAAAGGGGGTTIERKSINTHTVCVSRIHNYYRTMIMTMINIYNRHRNHRHYQRYQQNKKNHQPKNKNTICKVGHLNRCYLLLTVANQ